jgi:hypothetical protein
MGFTEKRPVSRRCAFAFCLSGYAAIWLCGYAAVLRCDWLGVNTQLIIGANMNWAQLAVNNDPDIHAAETPASAAVGTGIPPPSPPPADEGEEAPPVVRTLEEHADFGVAVSQAENDEQIELFEAEEAAVAEARANRRSPRGYRGEPSATATTSTDTADEHLGTCSV